MIIQLTARDTPGDARTIDAAALRALVQHGELHERAAAALEVDLGNDPGAHLELSIAGALLVEWLEQFKDKPSCYGTVHAEIERGRPKNSPDPEFPTIIQLDAAGQPIPPEWSTPGSLGDY